MRTRFLLADDDGDDVELFCEATMQISQEMECKTAYNGRKVFELLSHDQFHLPEVIFLDINMPIMDGWACLKGLKEDPKFSNIPTIMFSTSSEKTDVAKAYKLGALVFLTKPEDFGELCQILKIVAVSPMDSILPNLRGFKSVKTP